jgi:SAM-dependent methyltransferase
VTDLASTVTVRVGRRRVSVFDNLPGGRLLDIPGGSGEHARALSTGGHHVVSVDLFTAAYRGGGTIVQADANQTLPFRDGSFDYVLSREGIEHLENQLGFVRECRRVIRAGGTIVITTPNTIHLSARFSQFLTGQRSLHRGLINEEQSLRASRDGRFYHGHVFLLDYFRLRYMLRIVGFDAIEVFTDRYSPTSVGLAPFALAIRMSMRYAVWQSAAAHRRRKRRLAAPGTMDEIIGHVSSPALLFGKRMIIRAMAV